MKKIITLGYLSKAEWGGQYQPREQDFVISPEGCCMSIPASYSRHPFNVMEFIYEDNVQGSGGDSL